MHQFRIVVIVYVVCISSINGQGTCPTGISGTQECGLKRCLSGSICYRKKNARFCCEALDTFCPTKMHAFNSMEETYLSYLWGPAPSTGNDKWYNVLLGSEVIACPFPNSYAYFLYKELNVLPVDFDANNPGKSTPKTCIKNSDCNTDNDEFCGAAYHPTFTYELDGSGKDGAPLKFCYKFQQLGSTNVKPVIATDKTELTGCANNSECFPYKETETFCQTIEKPVRIAENNGTFANKKGFCAFEQTKSGAVWWYVLAASIVSTVICLGMSIAFFILHRKSVLKETELPTKTETNTLSNLGPHGMYKPNAPKTSKETTASKEKTTSKETMITSLSGL